MGREAKPNRLLVTGMRRGGETEYALTISGPEATHFPPMQVRMSLHELQRWLRDMHRPAAPGAAGEAPHRSPLRIVG